MAGQTSADVLRRIARPLPAPQPLTPARALRLSLTRAADRAMGLALGVVGVTEEEGPLDEILARLESGLMLRSLAGAEGPLGFIGLDAEARAAVSEAQALGRPSAQPADPRPFTAADAALAEPLLAAFLAEVGQATAGTALDGWVGDARLDGRLAGAREAGLLLPDGACRVVRLTLDLGAGGRQGLLVLMLRLLAPAAPAEPPAESPGWDGLLTAQVMRAPAPLRAVLHRARLTIEAAEGLRVGQVVPLPGVTVASVRIEGPDGTDLGPARLGQVAGMRAVRLEAPLAPRLSDMPRALPPAA
jgi:flagellar motor switch protein FliM